MAMAVSANSFRPRLIRLFISHATEDKEAIADPLADALIEAGFEVWYDKFSLKIGDSLKRQIDLGLSKTDFGIVILSKSFFSKQWPQDELDGLNVVENKKNKKMILPIWHDLSFEDVASFSPTLAGKFSINSLDGIPKIVQAIVKSINNSSMFVSRDDLEHGTIHVPLKIDDYKEEEYGNYLASAASGPIGLLKIPGISWEEFGENLLKEMKRLDQEFNSDIHNTPSNDK